MAQPPCINTEDLGCISPAKYRQERERIEQNHARQADFTNQWGLTAIRADRAYAHLELERGTGAAPGSGQTVGLIDTGIDTAHSMFAGKTVTEVILEGDGDAAGDETSHGTAVASVIVGDPSASYASSRVKAPRGVARAADVAMFAVQVGSGDGPHVPVTSGQLSNADSTWASFINSAKNWNSGKIDFVNVSLAFRGIIEQYSASGLRSSLGSTIAALAQAGSTDKTVFVWAAGNAHGAQCLDSDFTDNPGLCVRGNQTAGKGTVNARSVSVLAGLPARIPELRGHLIAAVAVAPDSDDDCKPDSNNECEYEIADFSNRCGIAADWCIAAPGENVRTAYFGPCPPDDCSQEDGVRGTARFSGTSFAAPMVVGGLVVLQDFFRDQMSNTELVSRLLSTANRSGIYSNSSVYGRGLMDLGAATAPVGSANVTLGDSINDSGYALAQTRLIPGGALGNSLTRTLGQHEIVAFDTLGAPFWMPLDGLLSGERSGAGYSGYSLSQRVQDFMDIRGRPMYQEQKEWSLMPERTGAYWPAGTDARAGNGLQPGWLQATSLANPGSPYGHLSLAEQALTLDSRAGAGLNVSAFTTEGMGHSAPASGAVMSWRPAWSQATPVNLKAGIVSERETLLGSHSSGAFGDVSEQAYFVGVGGGTMAGGWRLDAEAEIGAARPQVHGGLFDHISPLLTSAFSLSAQRTLAAGDVVSFSLSQPIRVERGHARLSVPVGRTKQGRVLHQSVAAELDADGRQLDFYGQWRHFLPGGSELRFGAGLAQQPGHVRSARTERFWMAGWLHSF